MSKEEMKVKVELHICNGYHGKIYLSNVRNQNTIIIGDVQKHLTLPNDHDFDGMFVDITNDDDNFREYKIDIRYAVAGYAMVSIRGDQINDVKITDLNNVLKITINDTALVCETILSA
jgi:hypothetical protein